MSDAQATQVFGAYSRYYDLLYRDKNYAGEARFVAELLGRHAPNSRRILELGCGGGKHALLLAQDYGFDLAGIDLSEDMLKVARQRQAELAPDLAARLRFSQGDVRDVAADAAGPFDAVISLFHVLSYQPENSDVAAMLASAARNLAAGGVFIFDCWYGPAVLTDRPAVRIKRMRDDNTEVTRLAEPHMLPNDCLVDVNYAVFVRDLQSQSVTELRETHRMRYFFRPELALFAQAAGFRIEHAAEWMSERVPSEETWGVYFVLRKL